MKKWKITGLLVIIVLLITAVPAFANGNGNGEREPWTGDPDPYACNEFLDCFWLVTVCIDGTTHEVGIHFDPEEAAAEEIEEQALFWSDTVLTVGACSAQVVIPNMWLLTQEGWPYPCILISETHPSVDRQRDLCFQPQDLWEPLGAWGGEDGWVADNAPCSGPVYSNDSWTCDGPMVQYNGERLPLYSDEGPDLWGVYQRHLTHIGTE